MRAVSDVSENFFFAVSCQGNRQDIHPDDQHGSELRETARLRQEKKSTPDSVLSCMSEARDIPPAAVNVAKAGATYTIVQSACYRDAILKQKANHRCLWQPGVKADEKKQVLPRNSSDWASTMVKISNYCSC